LTQIVKHSLQLCLFKRYRSDGEQTKVTKGTTENQENTANSHDARRAGTLSGQLFSKSAIGEN